MANKYGPWKIVEDIDKGGQATVFRVKDSVPDRASSRLRRAQMPQIGLPFLGLPALAVSTGLVGRAPVGVQIVNGRYREDPCLVVGEGGHRHRLARSDRHLRKAEALTRSMSRPCACCRSVAG